MALLAPGRLAGLYAKEKCSEEAQRASVNSDHLLLDSAVRPSRSGRRCRMDKNYQEAGSTAADAAAMAALLQFQSTTFSSDFHLWRQWRGLSGSPSCNPAPNNYLHSGCLYAQLNGFSSSGNQYVTMQAGVGVPPTATGVNSSAYWVTARVNQSVPQLFSAVLGNPSGLVSARATAVLSPARDCIYVMDPSGSGALSMSGTPDLVSACGVYLIRTAPRR